MRHKEIMNTTIHTIGKKAYFFENYHHFFLSLVVDFFLFLEKAFEPHVEIAHLSCSLMLFTSVMFLYRVPLQFVLKLWSD